jgi:hypothetical protein
MTINPNPNTPDTAPEVSPEQEPFIPPNIMLWLAALGIGVAVLVRLASPSFNVVGWGALGFTLLAIIAWVILAPTQARELMQGRALRFGGVAVLVTVLFLAALMFIYGFVKDRGWRTDLTQSENFTLTEQSREAMRIIASDPNISNIRIILFYSNADADRRDQDTVLLDDFVEAATPTGGTSKLSYEFVDPDRNPVILTNFEALAGNIVVVALNPDGTPNTDKKEIVDPLRLTTDLQTALTNAVLRVSATGDFRAYFLTVADGIPLTSDSGDESLSTLNESMQTFNWNLQQISFLDITGSTPSVTLNDPAADGEVLIIVGGSEALADEDLQVIKDYVAQGGDLIIFADPSDEGLATSANFNEWLNGTFGVTVDAELVLDQSRNYGSPIIPVVSEFSESQFVTSFFAGAGFVLFPFPHPLTIADTLPTNVNITELAYTGPDSYTRTYQELVDDEVEPDADSPRGPFVVAVAAENEVTGSRMVLFGSRDLASETLLSLAAGRGDVFNLETALRAMVWATRFDTFFREIPQIDQTFDPTDQPIFATSDQVRTINIITLLIMPFGVLSAGVLVWWFNRERPQA